MKLIIKHIAKAIEDVYEEKSMTNTSGKEHGSPDQTRGILLESIFNQVISSLELAQKQCEIIERELY